LYKQEKISSTGLKNYIGCVEVAFTSREDYMFNLSICKKTRDDINLMHQENDLNFDELKNSLKKITFFSIVITGKVVVHKKLSRAITNEQELIQTILPDAKTAEFCAQSFEFKGEHYGTIIRKDLLEKILNLFATAKLLPSEIIVGPFTIQLMPLLTQDANLNIHTSNYHIRFENGILFSLTAADKDEVHKIPVLGTEIRQMNMVGFSACINSATDAILISPLQNETAKKLLGEAKQKGKFKFLMLIYVGVLMAVTFTNFYFNRKYSEKHAQLDEQLIMNKQAIQEMEKLENEIAEKRSLVGKNSFNQGPVISIMADQLAKSVPQKIRLTNMEFFPLEGKIQKEKAMAFAYNKIYLEGISNETDVLDAWINQCKALKWVKDVLLVKYDFDNEQKKGYFKMEFTI
jgi:Tfp pilus assembly protein PilN